MAQGPFQLRGEADILVLPGIEDGLPLLFEFGALCADLAIEREHVVGHVEVGLQWPVQLLFRLLHVIGSQRFAVSEIVVLARRAVADVGAHRDERRAIGHVLRDFDRLVDPRDIVAVIDIDKLRVPAASVEPSDRVVA